MTPKTTNLSPLQLYPVNWIPAFAGMTEQWDKSGDVKYPTHFSRNLTSPLVFDGLVSDGFLELSLANKEIETMSKRTLWIVAVVITALALSLNTIAQPPGGGRGPGGPGGPGFGGPGFGGPGFGGGMGPGGPGAAFTNPEFAKLLGLTPEQTDTLQKELREAGEKFREEMQGAFQPGTPPNPEDMQKRLDKFLDGIEERTSKVLKPEQQTKSREVMFQLSGGLESPAMGSPIGIRLLNALDVTADQKEKIRKIIADREAENRTAMEGIDFRNMTPEEREKFRADTDVRNKKYTGQIIALLTPEQKAKGEKLTAETPALREKLGIPAPGQPGQGRGGQGQGRREQQGPGDQSWRPGQTPPPGQGAPPPRGNFPRGNNNPPPAPQ